MKNPSFPSIISSLPEYSGRFSANKLETDDVDIYFASYEAGTEIDSHSHDTDNHGIVTKGELVLITDGIEKKYEVGDWYFIAAYQEHSARFDKDTAEIEFWFKK